MSFSAKLGKFKNLRLKLTKLETDNSDLRWGIKTFTFELKRHCEEVEECDKTLSDENLTYLYHTLEECFYWVRSQMRKREGPHKVSKVIMYSKVL